MEILLKKGNFFFLKEGDLVEGKVMERKGAHLFLDLGWHGIGIVYGREFYAAGELIKSLKPGDDLSAKVVDLDNEDGYVELSLKEAGEKRKWSDLKKMSQEKEVLELPVLEANKGGLILEARGVKGFLPASQLSAQNYPRIDGGDKEKIYQELQKLVGQKLKVKIIDVNPNENKLIFSEKDQNSGETDLAMQNYKVGEEVEGEITTVVDFGAFMKFGETNMEGLIHISEIDWSLVENPKDILHPGDRVRAKIIDRQGGKISFSLKRLKDNPWEKISKKYKKGDEIKGKVIKFNAFGAFASLDSKEFCGIQGLAHISEFGTEAKMRENLELDKEYNFKIISIDAKEHRISLGM